MPSIATKCLNHGEWWRVWRWHRPITHTHRVLTCELCNATFSNTTEIYSHLRRAHKLATNDWNISRDSVDGTPSCAHCGSLRTNIEALRRRITYGSCKAFDALRSAETKALDTTIAEAIRSGSLLMLMNQTDNAFAVVNPTPDAPTWQPTSSKTMDFYGKRPLLTDFVMRQCGCVCNPSTPMSLTSHTCIGLRQIAMQFKRMQLPILVPYKFDQQALLDLMFKDPACSIPQSIAQHMAERAFEQLWTETEILQLLRSRCLICGCSLHAADLAQHLHQDHGWGNGLEPHYMTQLQQHIQDSLLNSASCQLCGLQFDTPVQPSKTQRLHAAQASSERLLPSSPSTGLHPVSAPSWRSTPWTTTRRCNWPKPSREWLPSWTNSWRTRPYTWAQRQLQRDKRGRLQLHHWQEQQTQETKPCSTWSSY